MSSPSLITRARCIGGLRAAVGVAMFVAPRAVARPAPDGTTGTELFLLRTIGIRDLALGLGTLASTRSTAAGADDDIRRWTRFGLVSDALDVVAGTAAVRWIGRDGALIAGGLPVPFAALDLWTLRGTSR